MGKGLKLCILAMACTLAFGCASKKSGMEDESMRAERFRRSYEAALDEDRTEAGNQLLRKARSAIGTPYVRGGSSPGGFDCSGLVKWAYQSVGVKLPRTAREQSVVGRRISNVEDMRAGDIVAFRHPRRGYHTGIYVGDGKFIHSPRRRTTVRINSLSDPYFSKTFLGARRVALEGNENLVAQAESRLSDFAEEKAVRELSGKKKSAPKSKSSVKKGRNARGKNVQVASNAKATRAQAAAKSAKSTKSAAKKKTAAASASKNKKTTATSDKNAARKVAAHSNGKNKKTPAKSRAKNS